MRFDLSLGLGFALLFTPPALLAQVQAQSVDELFQQGNAALEAGNYEEAERIWQEVIRLEPDQTAAFFGLAQALYGQNDLAGEIAAYRRVLEIDPNNANAYNNLGEALLENSRRDAIPEECLSIYPAPPVQDEACDALFDASRQAREDALEAFRQAIALEPEYARALNNLGLILPEDDPVKVESFRRAVAVQPDFAAAHYNLGDTLFSAAVGINLSLGDPEDPNAQVASEEEMEDAAKLADAISHFETSIALDSDSPAFVYSRLGRAYQFQGNLEAAIQNYRQAIALEPDDTYALNNLAEAERQLTLQQSSPPSAQEDLAWLPQNEPQLPLLRSVVRIAVTIAGGDDIGSGWVIKRDVNRLWILTSAHVVTDENANRPSRAIEAEFFSEPPAGQVKLRRPAELVQISYNEELDLALLVVDDAPLDVEPLPPSQDSLSRGTSVRLIGHPSTGLPWTFEESSISSISTGLLQISASLAPGNSGGPVLNEQNQVVGLVFKASSPDQAGTTAGFGFAYPLSYLHDTLAR